MNTPIDLKKIRDGDLLLFRTRGFSPFSQTIRFMTNSPFNHIAQITKVTNALTTEAEIIHALLKGVRKDNLSKYLDNPKYQLTVVRVRQNIFRNEEEYLNAIQTAIKRAYQAINKKYDIGAILGLSWRCLLIKTGLRRLTTFRSLLNRRMRFYCSELIVHCWKETSTLVQYIFSGKKFYTETTPHDIVKSLAVYFVTGQDYEFIPKRDRDDKEA